MVPNMFRTGVNMTLLMLALVFFTPSAHAKSPLLDNIVALDVNEPTLPEALNQIIDKNANVIEATDEQDAVNSTPTLLTEADTTKPATMNDIIADEQMASVHRRLPGFFEGLNVEESFNRLFSTPIRQWEAGQWLLAALMVFTILYCCGCIAGNRRYRRQGYGSGYGGSGYGNGYGNGYGGGYGNGYGSGKSGGSGFCSCLRNILLCFCCYELFCGDCAHVPCFRHSSFSGESNAIGRDEEDVYHREEGEMV